MSDAMRPSENWGAAAKEYAAALGSQSFLCASCVQAGVYEPPAQIVIVGGFSFCLSHMVATQ